MGYRTRITYRKKEVGPPPKKKKNQPTRKEQGYKEIQQTQLLARNGREENWEVKKRQLDHKKKAFFERGGEGVWGPRFIGEKLKEEKNSDIPIKPKGKREGGAHTQRVRTDLGGRPLSRSEIFRYNKSKSGKH